ncbi:MAG TPA: S8 family serine peptidase [Myxococcaceae bacterium]|nr:S8 family serine peptidase [Myxococcaceae bacterium]
MHELEHFTAPSRQGRAAILAVLLALPLLQACNRDKPAEPAGAVGSTRTALVQGARIIKLADGSDAVEGELLVRFKAGAESASVAQVHSTLQANVVHDFRSVPGLQLVRLSSGQALEEAMAAYRASPDILYAEPNYLWHTSGTPDDPRFDELWGLHNTGQDGGFPDADINAPTAWDLNTGSDETVVAVIDTGIDYRHEDLAANAWVNPGEIPDNDLDDDGNGYVDDVHGINAITNSGDPLDDNRHGTHCAGTIAAQGNNGVGVVGVNWNARVIGCKFLSATGSGSTADAVECLDYLYALKTRPTDPVNITATSNSWGGGTFSQALQDAIAKHAEAGILFVAAAGNSNANNDTTANYPSNYYVPNIIAVAATDRLDNRASFSSYGRRTVHVGAPGVDILSTTPSDTYALLSGTSMATPHVTGLVALLKAQDPSRDWRALKNLVISGGTATSAMTGNTISGKRIRAADTGGVGSLSCSDRVVMSRLVPIANDLQVLSGTAINLSALHINCANPNGDVVATVTPGGGTVTLTDDGVGFDQAAGDGLYSTEWVPPSAGTYTLSFPDGDVITVTAMDVYRPAQLPPAEWRTIAGTGLGVGDDTIHVVTTPFPIRYGNHAGFTTAYISSNGYLSFNTNRSTGTNANMPVSTFQALVAPFWDNLYTAATAPVVGDVYQEVLGTAPNREWVIEWRNMGQFSRRTTVPYPTITFQVVFTEGSSEVKFNYQDVDFGNGTDSFDRGLSATVGVQVNSTNSTRFSYNTRSLTNNSSHVYRINSPPLLSAVTTSVPSIQEGGNLNLNATFSDADGSSDADWTAEWDFLYDGRTFTVDATQAYRAEGAVSINRAFPQSGRYLVGVRVKDKDAGPSAIRTAVVVVDNVAPVAVAPTAAPAEPLEGQAVTFSASFDDVGTADNPWRVEWDFDYDGVAFRADRSQTYSARGAISVQHSYTEDGEYTVALRVVDKDSGVSALRTLPVVVADVSPTISVFTGTPTTGGEPRTVEFNVTAASGSPTASADPVRYYLWDFDGDGEADHLSTDPRALHRFLDNPPNGSRYSVTVWVEDEDSSTTRMIPVEVSNVAPSLADFPTGLSVTEGSLFQLQVNASDPAGARDPLSYELTGAPAGMSIGSTGRIQWRPALAQTARGTGMPHTVTVTVTDDDGGSASASFTVNASWLNVDGDGMPDTWEAANGLDPTRDDAAADADGDGISNVDEFHNANGGPFTPGTAVADSPLTSARVRSGNLTLRVNNTTDQDSTTLVYVFELFSDAALTQKVTEASANEDRGGKTAVVLNGATLGLADNTWYWWRARATDGAHPGAWSEPQKVFYTPLNDLPTAPTPVSPLAGERVGTALPRLVVDNASDPDDAVLNYRFEVFDNEAMSGAPVAAATVPAHASGSTRWTVDVPLANHGRYAWRVTAMDAQDGATRSTGTPFMVDLGNRAPPAPRLSAPANDGDVRSASATLVVDNVTDEDGDPVSYWFEVDTSPSFSSPERKVSPTLSAGSGGKTSWTVDALKEDARYYWRARASDGFSSSDWFVASFRVNAANAGPSVPVPVSPTGGAVITLARPALLVLNAVDPEHDAVTYEFEVREEKPDGKVLTASTGVPAGEGQTSFVVDRELPRGKPLYWLVRAHDAAGGASEWSAPALFTVGSAGCACGVTGSASNVLGTGLLPLMALALGLRRLRRRQ